MTISNPPLHISSTYKFFGLLMITLLLVNAYVVNAQNNANNTNSNTSNTNVEANRNSNANANTNSNVNQNGNSNQSGASADSGVESRRNKLADKGWFFIVVAAMFAIVLVPFVYTIIRTIRFSRATYSSPLGLPEGSLRAMLAYTLVAFVGFYILASILSFSDFKPPEFLLGIVATVIGFYFGSRSGEERAGSTRTGTVDGIVLDKNGTPAIGASVELSQSGVKRFTQTADTNGKYKLENVPVGDYDIQASLPGNAPSDSAKVKVTAGAAQTVPLKLK